MHLPAVLVRMETRTERTEQSPFLWSSRLRRLEAYLGAENTVQCNHRVSKKKKQNIIMIIIIIIMKCL